MRNNKIIFENVIPNPEFLIKSISEQGYSFESAIADLIDNSIFANAKKIEVLTSTKQEPFKLYLTDDGNGMSENELKENMKFPSLCIDEDRSINDLGRFGLGLKTASFSQTRKFTVITRKKGTDKYFARTWDLNILKTFGEWKLIVNTDVEVNNILRDYRALTTDYYESFVDYSPNTIIIWEGLYKFEEYLEGKNRKNALKKEITEITTEHLSLVFHRFMEQDNPLQIRVNNIHLTPFNPFPNPKSGIRPIEAIEKKFSDDVIKLEGFILPSNSISDLKASKSVWTTKFKSLTDMEGIYIYRADRIISFGGWNGIIKKAPRLQLARLRVEIGNKVDHLLHLNVAKSQVIVPHDLKTAFESYIENLKKEAIVEFYNRNIQKIISKKQNKASLFEKKLSNKGVLLEINNEFPLLKIINEQLPQSSKVHLNVLIKMINTQMNKIRDVHKDKPFLESEEEAISINEMCETIKYLKNTGIDIQILKSELLPHLGYEIDTFPSEILKELNE